MKMVFNRPRELRITREFIEDLLWGYGHNYWDASTEVYCVPVEELLITEERITPWLIPSSNLDEERMGENLGSNTE